MTTLSRWDQEYPEFRTTRAQGKLTADADVAESLYHRSIGASWTEQQAFKVRKGQFEDAIEVVEVQRAAPPDTQAISFWLSNRQARKWKVRSNQALTGPNDGPIQVEDTRRPLTELIASTLPKKG